MTEKEFVSFWKEKISKELLKSFPVNFIEEMDCEKFDLPGKALLLNELFNSYEIIDSDGNTYFTTNDYSKAKYILYATRLRPKQIMLPKNERSLKTAVKEYEKLLDYILKSMENHFVTEFPQSDKFLKVSNLIFNSLNLQRY